MSNILDHCHVSHNRPYVAKSVEHWSGAAGAVIGGLLLTSTGVGTFAMSLIGALFVAGAELRLLVEGPEWESARGVVVRRDTQALTMAGLKLAEIDNLTIDYLIPFGNCHHAAMDSRSRLSCATRNHQWPQWWPQYLEREIFVPQNLSGRDSGHPEEDRPNHPVPASPGQSRLGQSFRVAASSEHQSLALGSVVSMRYPHAYPSEARLLIEKMDQRPIGWLKRMESNNLGGILFFAFFGALSFKDGIDHLVFAHTSCYRLFRLARHGRCAKAQIVDRWIDKDQDHELQTILLYCVAYRFQPPAGPPCFAAEINLFAYNSYWIGREVVVKFDPQQPENCRLLVPNS